MDWRKFSKDFVDGLSGVDRADKRRLEMENARLRASLQLHREENNRLWEALFSTRAVSREEIREIHPDLPNTGEPPERG